MSSTPALLDELVRLADENSRPEAAATLAARLGAQALIIFVRDPALGVLVPAPGFAQTVRGGPGWRRFLGSLGVAGRHAAEVDLPPGTARPAVALVTDRLAAVLVGGTLDAERLGTFEAALPLLCATFAAEQRAALAEAHAVEADKSARRTQALVDALETARAEAWRLNAQLTEEHRQRDDFLAMLAHELRNPLAPLVTAIALLRRGGPAVVGTQLDLMDRQLRQLSRMVDDLLDVSRVKHGKIELRRQALVLRDTLLGAIDGMRPMFESRGHALEISLPEQPLTLDADGVRLMQVFYNLLHNAAKYTDPGGRIRVEVKREDDQAVIRIADNGVGIDPETLPHVFQLFVQAPVALDRGQGGLGIGLTLVRSLVEMHGGTVSASSPGRGGGSTFEVRLPLSTTLAAQATSPDSTPPCGESAAARVLVVDDNRDLTESLALLLRMMGHKVDVAHSGWHALQIAQDVDPDLVLLDIGLPDLDGYEAGRRLRRILRADTLLIAMTGYGSSEDRRRSAEAGFDDHLVKPVEPERLESILANLVSREIAFATRR
ncbi:MAG: ATP-binding protein [Casimicrobiaceae bacterium]